MEPEIVFPQGLPALKDVKIGTPVTLPGLSYHQLSSLHLKMTFFTPVKFHNMLSQCTMLKTLALYDDFSAEWHTTPLPSLNIPSLSSLHLYGEISLSKYLLLISAPRLRHLNIASVFNPDELDRFYTLTTGVGAEKFAALTILTLAWLKGEEFPIYRHDVRFAPPCFPRIEELTFAGDGVSAMILALHTATPGDPGHPFNPNGDLRDDDLVWPQLHSLAVTDSIRRPRDLVLFREQAGSPLRRICLDARSMAGQDAKDLPWLKERLEVVERDVWDEFRREGLYYPYREFTCDNEYQY